MINFPRNQRMTFIDGLRAIAALMVLLPHSRVFWGSPTSEFSLVSILMLRVSEYGIYGINVFFVISGFVIAYSFRQVVITPSWFGKFILRRSIRLDPPYWISIVISLFVLWFRQKFGHLNTELPSLNQIIAHLLYLQDILGIGNPINIVYWTLSIEIQFYLILGLSLVILNAISKQWFNGSQIVVTYPLILLWIISFAFPLGWLQSPQVRTFLPYWYMLFSGVLLCWTIEKRVPSWIGLVMMFWIWFVLPFSINREDFLIFCLTLTSTYCCSFTKNLYSWLNVAPIQFLGKISYSLYLIHIPVVSVIASLWSSTSGKSDFSNICFFIIFVASSIATATILFYLVETPALLFSRKIKLNEYKAMN